MHKAENYRFAFGFANSASWGVWVVDEPAQAAGGKRRRNQSGYLSRVSFEYRFGESSLEVRAVNATALYAAYFVHQSELKPAVAVAGFAQGGYVDVVAKA